MITPMREGKAEFIVGHAFYRQESQIARDLGVLAAAIYQQETGELRVLDGMTGSGVRALRYWLESGATWIWANEGNPEIQPTLEENLRELLRQKFGKITYQDLNRLLFDCYTRRDYYDLVDIDGFGSPAPFLHSLLMATKMGGLMYLTSSDGRSATGHNPESSLKTYGAYARSHPSAHEQGLRLILGAVQLEAARLGWGIEPIFALFFGETYRVMMRLRETLQLNSRNYGFLGYCHHCGEYQAVSWQKLGRASCLQDGESLTLTGPMWLGRLHDVSSLKLMIELAKVWKWTKQGELLENMCEEADFPPYFYTLKEIGRRGKLDVPKKRALIGALQNQGYRTTKTHINPQAIKTTASLAECIAVSRQLSTVSDR
jgi:tRNA (guanine26-N2/guanine27-N2)-dimethyltransferase